MVRKGRIAGGRVVGVEEHNRIAKHDCDGDGDQDPPDGMACDKVAMAQKKLPDRMVWA
jgi:hypothetical protein